MSIINQNFSNDNIDDDHEQNDSLIISNQPRKCSRPSSLIYENYYQPSSLSLIIMNDNDNYRTSKSNEILETQLDNNNNDNINDIINDNFVNEDENNYEQSLMNNELMIDNDDQTKMMFMMNDSNSAMVAAPSIDNQQYLQYNKQIQEVGIYGWRKKFLYILLVINVVLVGINFALAFWIVSMLGLSSNGIGLIDFGSNRNDESFIRIHGTTIFEKLLFAKNLQSFSSNDELRMTSKNGDITFRSYSDNNNDNDNVMNQTTSTKLVIKNNKIQIFTDHFEVYDRRKTLMFALDSSSLDDIDPKARVQSMKPLPPSTKPSKDVSSNQTSEPYRQQQITIRSNAIKYSNDMNSLSLPISIQTPSIINSIDDVLKLYSPQSQLLLRGPKSIHLESKLGDISIVTYNNLRLQSNGGRIILDGRAIYMQKLPSFNQSSPHTFGADNHYEDELPYLKPEVYQLCICSKSGRIFMSESDQPCHVKSYRDCR